MESVGQRLSEANGLPALRYHVLDREDQNAFVSPTGLVVVYTGLLKVLDSPDELAVVLAHEMAHFLARECGTNPGIAHIAMLQLFGDRHW